MVKPLVQACLAFIRDGRKATVKGREIGESLIALIDAVARRDDECVADFHDSLATYVSKKEEALKRGRREDALILLQDQFETLLKLLAPFAPHITEEIWRDTLGHDSSIHIQPWPEYDENLVVEDEVTIAVQVNGKARGEITVSKDASEDEVRDLAMGEPSIGKWTEGKNVAKVIYVPSKIINLVLA